MFAVQPKSWDLTPLLSVPSPSPHCKFKAKSQQPHPAWPCSSRSPFSSRDLGPVLHRSCALNVPCSPMPQDLCTSGCHDISNVLSPDSLLTACCLPWICVSVAAFREDSLPFLSLPCFLYLSPKPSEVLYIGLIYDRFTPPSGGLERGRCLSALFTKVPPGSAILSGPY